MIDYGRIPIHGDLRIPKSMLSKLPDEFEEIPDSMGDRKDAIRQYRGPHNTHVLEYLTEWSFHRDHADPRVDPFGHLILDTPEIPAAALSAIAVGKKVYDESESLADSIVAGGLTGVLVWALVKGIKEPAEQRR